MCGIAGVLSNQPSETLLTRISCLKESLKHRGPDSDGSYISSDKHVGLVHTRLAILDLSSNGHQPMKSLDNRYTIVYNGEIYNSGELRNSLISNGVRFSSNSDTEVLLALYQKHGSFCCEMLRGMFAFAIFDSKRDEVFFARDSFGMKPLYYAFDNSSFIFASEYKSIKNLLSMADSYDLEGMKGFITKGSVPEPLTLDLRIKMFPVGCCAYWKKMELERFRKYADLSVQGRSSQTDVKKSTELVRKALEDSVRHHFVSDVEVGLFLSGGLDSTALLALSHELGYSGIASYTVGFENCRDETGLARKTAHYFGANHCEVILNSKAADEILDEYLSATDQPTIDGFNIYSVSKFAKSHGAKVILSGLGGDELFGGYPSMKMVPQLFQLASNPIGKFGMLCLSGFLMKTQKKSKWKRLYEKLNENINIRSIYDAYRGVFTNLEFKEIAMTLGIYDKLVKGEDVPINSTDTRLPLEDQVCLLEWQVYLRDQLLRDADIFSMSFGLELRMPFVDRNLFEVVSSVIPSIRLNRKTLLKMAVPEIPSWVMKQSKQGFLFPFSSWDILGRHFKSKKTKRIAENYSDWYQKWALLQLDHFLFYHDK